MCENVVEERDEGTDLMIRTTELYRLSSLFISSLVSMLNEMQKGNKFSRW